MTSISIQCKSLYDGVQRHLKNKDLKKAALMCKDLCEAFPRFAEGWSKASLIALRLGNHQKALEFIDRAIEFEPSYPVHKLQKVKLLLSVGEVESAKSLVDIVSENVEADDSKSLSILGGVYSSMGLHSVAITYYQKLYLSFPDDAANLFNLAATYRFLGDLDASEKAYDKGIQLSPDYYESYMIRSGLRKQTTKRNHVSELELILLNMDSYGIGEVQICYALAKELEDLSEYERSFSYLQRGASLRRSNMKYHVESDLVTIDKIIATYSKDMIAEAKGGYDCDKPIFIVGLPRTGTTLVERIISSHKDVCSGGELNAFAVELTKLIKASSSDNPDNKVNRVLASVNLDFEQLGRQYIKSCESQVGSNSYFIDKMPLNYLYCGLIALALPKAKIIEVVRHPMDACYAMYKQLFTKAYPFSYDLDDLGRYYLAQKKLMDHWREVLPGRIHQVSYEDIVSNQESQTQSLLQYCGLDWDAKCLAFEENDQASTTASAAQIRQPIYTSSVNKWTWYSEQLRPLKDRFVASGIDI